MFVICVTKEKIAVLKAVGADGEKLDQLTVTLDMNNDELLNMDFDMFSALYLRPMVLALRDNPAFRKLIVTDPK